MGEYGNYAGSRVKLGTCEDMYYLRWDQTPQIRNSDLSFTDPDILQVIRFRFPFPDEDGVEPGAFDPFERGLRLWGVEVPSGVEHHPVQFSAPNGYLVSLPCPEGPGEVWDPGSGNPYTIHRNGYGGPCSLVQQGWREGRLVGIARCNGCGAVYRLDGGSEEAAAVAIRSQGDERIRDRDRYNAAAEARGDDEQITGDNGAAFYHETADRLLAGYALTLEGALRG